jgi:3-hydroxy-9,10-secoandrosta-1,3,5(10)-triene-9,17-dione monooxygenase
MAITHSLRAAPAIRDELLRRARELVPVLAERAPEAERLRRLPDETVADLRRSELLRIANPDRYGGHGIDFDLIFDVSWELARGCGSSGWCYSIWAVHNWLAGHFPERCQDEFFAGGPDVLCSSSFNPDHSRARPAAGGYIVSGHWEFSSGSDAAGWAMLGTVGPDGPRWILVPRSDYEVVDTWFVSGLCGTGSNDIVMEDAFVPAHRTLDISRAGEGDWTGWELHGRPSYRAPLRVMLGWDIVSPLIGIAQAGVDRFVERIRTTGSTLANSAPVQMRVAEAAAEIHTARVLFRHTVDEILTRAGHGETFTPIERAGYARNRAMVVKLCLQAVNRLFEVSGAHALFQTEPLQRIHRDAHALTHRTMLVMDFAGEAYGRLALGGSAPPPLR